MPAEIIDRRQHSEANFNPEQYEVLEYLDNRPPSWANYAPDYRGTYTPEQWASQLARCREDFETATARWNAEMDQYFPGRHGGNPDIHKCTHCGNTQVRYITAVKHRPTGHVVVFGDVCVERLRFANYNAFKAAQVRSRAATGHARLIVFQKREKFLSEHPELAALVNNQAELSHPDHANNSFLHDVISKLNKYGALSERQVAAVLRSAARDHEYAAQRAERQAQDAARRATATPAPEGRCQLEGEVACIKLRNEGPAKMLVVLTNGAKVWLTAPSGVYRNDRIRFQATLTRSADDPFFSFGKRPSNVKVLSSAAGQTE